MEGAFRHLIEQMVTEVNRGPAIYRPSEFWVRLNDLHEAQLTDAGFESLHENGQPVLLQLAARGS